MENGAEKTARDAEAVDAYRMFFENIPDLACICSSDGHFIDVNPAWEKQLGYPPQELIGRSYLALVHPDDLERTQAEAERRDVPFPTPNFKNRYLCKDGTFRWLEWNSGMPAEGDRIVAVARDVTERIRKEEELRLANLECLGHDQINEELRKSQELLQAIVNGTVDCIFAKDVEGRYLLINREAAAMRQKRLEDIIGRGDDVLFAPQEAEVLRENDRQVLSTGQTITVQEVVTDFNGRECIFLSTKGPLYDRQGNITGIFGIARNITDLVHAEEALLRNQEQLRLLAIEISSAEEKERRRIAAELHDEIGQNLALAKIKLHENFCRDEPTAGCIRSMRELGDLLEATIQEVRSLTFQISPPLLYEVGFEAAVEWLSEQFEEKHHLRITMTCDASPMQLDEELSSALYHVVRELLVNVVKHAQAKKVGIVLQRVDDWIKVVVQDDGKGFGIPAESAERELLGGFGLFNIRQRVQHLGGVLQIESGVGSGSTVTVRVPAAAAPMRDAQRRSQ